MGYYQVSRPVARRLLLVNNMNNGWIKIHRKLKDKGYYRKSQYVHLWLHLLLSANHETKEFMWNNNIIFIKEGQLLTGRKQLSHETGISQTTVERILKMLENGHQIGQQKTTKYRLITILNWTTYQKTDSKTDSKRTTSGQQADTNKNDKNVRIKEENTSEQSSQVGELIDLSKEVNKNYENWLVGREPPPSGVDDNRVVAPAPHTKETITKETNIRKMGELKYQPINDEGQEVKKYKGLKKPISSRGVFNYEIELEKLRTSPKTTDNIAALFFFHRKLKFENWDQYYPYLARTIHTAKLLKGYSGKKVDKVIEYCKKKWPEDWTLETCVKWIAEVNK